MKMWPFVSYSFVSLFISCLPLTNFFLHLFPVLCAACWASHFPALAPCCPWLQGPPMLTLVLIARWSFRWMCCVLCSHCLIHTFILYRQSCVSFDMKNIMCSLLLGSKVELLDCICLTVWETPNPLSALFKPFHANQQVCVMVLLSIGYYWQLFMSYFSCHLSGWQKSPL